MKNLRQHRRFFVLSDTSEQTAQRGGRFAPARQSEPVNCGKGNAAGVDNVK